MIDAIFWWVGCVVCCAGAIAASGGLIFLLGSLAFWSYSKFLDRLGLWKITRIFHAGGWVAIRAANQAKWGGGDIEDWREYIDDVLAAEGKEASTDEDDR